MKTRRTKPLISQFSGRWARIVLGVLFTAFAVRCLRGGKRTLKFCA